MISEQKILDTLSELKHFIATNDEATQATVAQFIGVHQTTVGRWLKGDIKNIKSVHLIGIQRVLDMSYESIKDKYIRELERRCKRLERENQELKKELRNSGVLKIVR